MNEPNIADNLTEDNLPEQPQDDALQPGSVLQPKSVSMGLRIGVAVIALIILGVVAYPFIQKQLQSRVPTEAASTVEVPVVPNEAQAKAQANPDSAAAQFELGNSYYEAGQLEQAIAAYQKAVELDPNYQAAYANLGVAYYQQQQFDLAASQYEKALELNPQDGEVAYNLGALYLQQALTSNPPEPKLLDNAVEQLTLALTITPDLAEPHFTLGVAYLALNQPQDAVKEFETFLSLDTGRDPRAKQEAEHYLELLQQQQK